MRKKREKILDYRFGRAEQNCLRSILPMGNIGSGDEYQTKVECAPQIVPVDDLMTNKDQLQNYANFHFSNGKNRVERIIICQS